MARGPDGQGGGAGFSLADQLFNADSLGDLAREFSTLPGFDAERFHREALAGMATRTLLDRLEHIADCLEAQLAPDFPTMADQLEAAMPPPLSPQQVDDDFGRFIHAPPGILAVRHGLEEHRERALDLLFEATKRFSMEFYIRPFLNRWPDETLARLRLWARDENYHVRRLVSEGTRPKLPWAKNITLDPQVPLEFLARLHADPTRYVTRSVANHLNDIWKIAPEAVYETLADWQKRAAQDPKELAWLTRHALRSAVKAGAPEALALLGYRADSSLRLLSFATAQKEVPRGAPLVFEAALTADCDLPVIVDYIIHFVKADGRTAPKTFKLKQAMISAGQPLRVSKTHKLKWDATTFRLYPGVHRVQMQVNGMVLGDLSVTLQG
ncbi:hypothetical protein [Primorskyibacter sp. S187A]|uniref:hypothetical protein n=1 Tax=Primorskyibacter sp. S187A TaxID=3415130 RepID=UPI003C7A2B41